MSNKNAMLKNRYFDTRRQFVFTYKIWEDFIKELYKQNLVDKSEQYAVFSLSTDEKAGLSPMRQHGIDEENFFDYHGILVEVNSEKHLMSSKDKCLNIVFYDCDICFSNFRFKDVFELFGIDFKKIMLLNSKMIRGSNKITLRGDCSGLFEDLDLDLLLIKGFNAHFANISYMFRNSKIRRFKMTGDSILTEVDLKASKNIFENCEIYESDWQGFDALYFKEGTPLLDGAHVNVLTVNGAPLKNVIYDVVRVCGAELFINSFKSEDFYSFNNIYLFSALEEFIDKFEKSIFRGLRDFSTNTNEPVEDLPTDKHYLGYIKSTVTFIEKIKKLRSEVDTPNNFTKTIFSSRMFNDTSSVLNRKRIVKNWLFDYNIFYEDSCNELVNAYKMYWENHIFVDFPLHSGDKDFIAHFYFNLVFKTENKYTLDIVAVVETV